MTTRLNPYLNFDGNAREAMEFYQTVFGGELTLNTFASFGSDDPAIKDRIMHGDLRTEAGYVLFGSDIMPGMPFQQGTTMTVSLSGDEDILREYFAKLGAGGSVTMPMEKQMWGAEYGQLTDRFGVAWMVNLGPEQD